MYHLLFKRSKIARMKPDVKGCSVCQPGQESYKMFHARRGPGFLQYDYRDTDGELFSCIGHTLEICQEKRDEWLEKKNQNQGEKS